MKKLLFAAMLSAVAVNLIAAEATTEATPKAATAAEKSDVPPPPPPPEDGKKLDRPKKFDRAKFEERMKARKAERAAMIVEVLKKYGLEGEKAVACADEIMKLRQRRPSAQRPNAKRPPAKPE